MKWSKEETVRLWIINQIDIAMVRTVCSNRGWKFVELSDMRNWPIFEVKS